MRRFGMSMSMSSQRRRRSRSQAEIVWELFVMARREATAAGLVRIVVCLRISVARRPTGCGSNVTRCVKIIDFPWLDCCWLSKFNHNMQQRKRKRAREWEKRQRERESVIGQAAAPASSPSPTAAAAVDGRQERQHVAKLTTWIFNFASQQLQVICCVDVPGVADEQWPGTRHQAARRQPKPKPEKKGGRGGGSSAARRVDQFILMQTTHINSCATWQQQQTCSSLDARSTDWSAQQRRTLSLCQTFPPGPNPAPSVVPCLSMADIVRSVTQYVRPLQLPSCKVQRNSLI